MIESFYIKELYSCYQRKQNVEKYRDYLNRVGYVEETESNADRIYIWTCAFRKDAKENSIKRIRELRGKYPDKQLYICGCMTTIAPKETMNLATEVSAEIIPWKTETDFFDEDILAESDSVCGIKPITADVEKYKRDNPNKPVSFADQFIKLCISEGCTCDCAYCSEKRAFPKYKSFPVSDLRKKCAQLVEETGFKRVILVGDSPGEYGRDIGTNITCLIEELISIDKELQIVLSNYHPRFFIEQMDYLMGLIRQRRIYHINLPIQSGASRVLKLMRRNYNRDDLEEIFSMLCEAGFDRYDTHVLVGYDGEKDEDFMETVSLINKYKPRYVLASKYMYAGDDKDSRNGIVSEADKQRRCEFLAKHVNSYGGIINYDGNDLSRDRWNRLNKGGRNDER